MDLSNESNPYYALRDQDLVEWHLWKRSTVELARCQRKDLRVVIGSYYSQDAYFLEKSRYRDQALAFSLNQTYVNVIVDRDELPAFEHFYRSIVVWKLDLIEENNLFYGYANLPLVLVLDRETLLPKRLHNEMNHLDVEVDFDVDPKLRLIVDRPEVASDPEEVTRSPKQQKSCLEMSFKEYLEDLFDRAFDSSLNSIELLWDELDSLGDDVYSTGAQPLANVVQYGKVVNYVLDEANLDTYGGLEELDFATVLLTRLAASAHFDHLRGGFFRSKVEKSKVIPMSEKRLTVSAYLLEVYGKVLWVEDNSLFESVVRMTADYLSDQITSQDTFPTTVGDLSRPDASHYAWDKKSLKRLLTKGEFRLMETLYGLNQEPNYKGCYLLERQDPWSSVVDRLDLEPDQAMALHESARQKMLEARNDSELVADDRVNPLTCAAVSRALTIAATTLGEPAYFKTARRVMDSIVKKFDVVTRAGEFDTSGSEGVRLKTVDALFIVDTLLVMLEHKWHGRWYEMVDGLWDFIETMIVDDGDLNYCKPQFFGEQKPSDFIAVPDFVPIFDYQSDRRAETTVFMDVARKIANLRSIWRAMEARDEHAEVLEKSIDRKLIEHIEYLNQAYFGANHDVSIVLRGPIDKCRYWKASIRLPHIMRCQFYVIPYGLNADFFLLPEYLRTGITERVDTRVTAFLVSVLDDKLLQFTNLMKLNAYLQVLVDEWRV